MKPSAFALLLSSVIAGAAFATNALAVDTITSRDAPDLTAIRAKEAEAELHGKKIDERAIARAADAAREAAEPQSDMRGSADYKRALIAALVKRAIGIAVRRARGENVEAGHEYVGR